MMVGVALRDQPKCRKYKAVDEVRPSVVVRLIH